MAITLYTQMPFLSPTPFKSLPSMTCGPFTVGYHTVYAGAIPIAHPLQISSQHDTWTLHSRLSRWKSWCDNMALGVVSIHCWRLAAYRRDPKRLQTRKKVEKYVDQVLTLGRPLPPSPDVVPYTYGLASLSLEKQGGVCMLIAPTTLLLLCGHLSSQTQQRPTSGWGPLAPPTTPAKSARCIML